MGTFDLVILASVLCGLIMILGSLYLLRKGIITLSEKSQEEALSIEFKKSLRISSHYPAIVLFIIGASFIFVPLVILKPTQKTLGVEGLVRLIPMSEINHVKIKFIGGPWRVDPDSDGSVAGEITPSLSNLRVEVTAPGRPTYTKTLSIKNGEISLGDIDLGKALVEKKDLTRRIGSVNKPLPSLDQAGQGGF